MVRQASYSVDLASIRRRLPKGAALPPTFAELARWCAKQPRGSLGWFRLQGRSPDALVGSKTGSALVPFMVLPDGGFVGFWFDGGTPPPIVWIDSEGQGGVAAVSWPSFLRKLVERKTGVFDLDDQERGDGADPPAAWRKARVGKDLAPIRAAFRRWRKVHAPRPDKVPKAAAEKVRGELVRLCKPYWRGVPDYLRMTDFVVTVSPSGYDVRWYAGGLKRFPGAARMRAAFTALHELFGRDFKNVPVGIWGDGNVFVDKNTNLAPPGTRR